MGQVRQESATTTHAVRAAMQRSQASLAQLSRELRINPRTVAKWRKRVAVEDMKTGPKGPHLTALTEEEEAAVVAFRRHTLLRLDDCLYAVQPSIPHVMRSALHRCLQRHGISRLPDVEGDKPKRQKFKRNPIGFFHIDIAEVQTAEGKLYHFVGIDRIAELDVGQLVATAGRKTAWGLLQHMLEAAPYQVHTILTDNGIQFAEQSRNRNTIYSQPMRFDMICEANGIEHRLTKPNHPWTNVQVEWMNPTIKDATVKRFHYENHKPLRTHLADFMAAYNFARLLKTLGGLTPYEYICKIWTLEPDRFILDPIHQMPGLNTQSLFFVALHVYNLFYGRRTSVCKVPILCSKQGAVRSMRIVIIGAEGDIGSAICAELSDRHELVKVGRTRGDIRMDIGDKASIKAMYERAGQVDAVVCAVGNVHFGPLIELTEEQFMLGLTNKVMGQINVVLEGLRFVSDRGSFTLTSGVLDRDPIPMGAGAATANGALGGFVVGASIEMPRSLRLNVVSPGLLEASVERYGRWFPGHEPVSSKRVGLAYAKSIEGARTGQVIVVE